MTASEARLIEVLCMTIKPLLAGHGAQVQGAVLAELFATWLASFQGADREPVRAELLASWLKTVRELIPECEKEIIARVKPDGNA